MSIKAVVEDQNILANLTNSLQQVRDKLRSQISVVPEAEAVRHNQETFMKKSNEKLDELRAKISEFKNAAALHKKESATNSCRLDALKYSVEHQQKLIDAALVDKEKIHLDMSKLEENCAKKRQELNSADDVVKQKAQEMEKVLQMGKDYMHLSIKKISGDRLQFVYTYIDPKDTSKPFGFCVRIIDRVYSVSDCHPDVADLPELVTKLNQTNSLRSFVITMRSRYKSLV